MTELSTALHFASALSDAGPTADALDDVVDQLRAKTNGDADLLVIFATAHHGDDFALIHARLRSALSAKLTVGATVQGVIGVKREVERGPGLSVLAATIPGASLEPIALHGVMWSNVTKDPGQLRRWLPSSMAAPKAVMLLGDPFTPGLMNMLPALGEALPAVPIAGGMASAAQRAGENRLLLNGAVYERGAVGVAFGGDVRIDAVVSQGCRPIGKPFVITKNKRHIVLELGGRTAMTALSQVVGDLDDTDRELMQRTGLLVGRVIDEYKPHFGRGDFLIRSLLGADESRGYIAINDLGVRTGQTIQFHVRDQRTAIEDFTLMLEAQKLHGPGAGGLLFSCNGRGTNLFDKPDTDATLIHDAMGDMPLAGFFAAGEIGPIGEQNFVHGHTASLMLFRAGRA